MWTLVGIVRPAVGTTYGEEILEGREEIAEGVTDEMGSEVNRSRAKTLHF